MIKKDKVYIFCQLLDSLDFSINEISSYFNDSNLNNLTNLSSLVIPALNNLQSILISEKLTHISLEPIIKNISSNQFTFESISNEINLIDQVLETVFIEHIVNEILSSEELLAKQAFSLLMFIERCSCNIDYIKPSLYLKLSLAIQESNPSESFIYMIKAFELEPDLEKKINGIKNYKFDKNDEQIYFENCPVCNSEFGDPYFNAFSYLMSNFSAPFLPAKLWIKCNNCNNLYTYAFPKQYTSLSESLELIKPQSENNNTISEYVSNLSTWSEILNKLSKYSSGKDILEVGIGNGEFIAVALEMNYDIECIEILKGLAQKISNILNINIYCCDFLKFNISKKYSIITMGDVIEHVTDPTAALNKAYKLLEDDGVLWISTPNYQSSFSRLRKFSDAMWNEPTHITYFNYNTFSSLLSSCGFEVVEYLTSNRWNGSMELIVKKKISSFK